MTKRSKKDAGLSALGSGTHRSLLRSLTEASPLPVLITDPVGGPLFANQLFQHLVGPVPPNSWLELVESSDRAGGQALWLEAGLERVPREAELRLQTADGLMTTRCCVAPVETKDSLLGWAVTLPALSAPEAAELQDVRARLAETEARLHEAQASQQRLDEMRLQTVARLLEVEEALEHNIACSKKVEAEWHRTQALLERAEAQQAQTIQRLHETEGLLERSETERQRAADRIVALEQRLEDRDAHCTLAEAQRSEAQTLLEQSEAQRHELMGRLHDVEEVLKDTKAQALGAEVDLHELQSLLERSEGQLAQISPRLHQLEELLEEGNQRIAVTEAQRDQAQSLALQSEAQGQKLRELLEGVDAQRAQMVDRLRELEQRMESTNAKLIETKTERHELRSLLEGREAHLAETNLRIHELEGLLECSRTGFARTEAERNELQSLLEQFETQRERLEEHLGNAGARLAEVEAQLTQAVAERNEIQTLLERSEAQRSAVEEQKARSEAQLERATVQRQQAQARLEESIAQTAELLGRQRTLEQFLLRRSTNLVQTEVPRDVADELSETQEREGNGYSASALADQDETAAAPTNEAHLAKTNCCEDPPKHLRPVPSSLLSRAGEDIAVEVHPTPARESAKRSLGADAELDQLVARLRSRVLSEALARWRAARGAERIPCFDGWDESIPDATGYMVIDVDEAGNPTQVRNARPLTDKGLLRALAAPVGGEGHGWQRCAVTGQPAYHYAHVGLGPVGSRSFERLLLPFSSEGERVDRLVLLMVTGEAEASPRHVVHRREASGADFLLHRRLGQA